MEKNRGEVYIVPTPLGNLKDITLRALEVLRSVDIIYCEDTRVSLKILNSYEIKKPLKTCQKFNEKKAGIEILNDLNDGKDIAIISDAGTPLISDPGNIIVEVLRDKGYKYTVLPGACAAITALCMSGMDCSRFSFYGFVPVENKLKKEFLNELEKEKNTAIIYESPHKIKRTLRDMNEIFPNRNIAICKEMSKIYENLEYGKVSDVFLKFPEEPKGEFVMILEGNKEAFEIGDEAIKREVKNYIDMGFSGKDSVKIVSSNLNIAKNKVYNIYLEIKKDDKTGNNR